MSHKLPSSREQGNTWTHLAGAVFALSSIWMVWPAVYKGWEWAFGVIFFITGMFPSGKRASYAVDLSQE